MKPKLKRTIFFTGAVGAAAITLTRMLEKTEKKQASEYAPFKELIRNQTVCDEVDGAELSEWFEEQMAHCDKEMLLFLAKPTPNTIKMFALSPIPKGFDAEHHLLQAVVDKETYETEYIRLISFATLAEGVSQLLDGKEYTVVQGGA